MSRIPAARTGFIAAGSVSQAPSSHMGRAAPCSLGAVTELNNQGFNAHPNPAKQLGVGFFFPLLSAKRRLKCFAGAGADIRTVCPEKL